MARRRNPSWQHRLGAAFVISAMLATPLLTAPTARASARTLSGTSPVGPCAGSPAPRRVRHVVWILMENQGFKTVTDKAAAPFLSRLEQSCGLATNYVALAHPSLPNYLTLTAGSALGVTDDAEPIAHRLDAPNLFSQLRGNWRALEESMPAPCDTITSGDYAARHNPAVYFINLRRACRRDDVPLRLPLDLSTAFTFITPNVCDDMHSCPVATGDRWLARIVPLITRAAVYRAGDTALFITFDESDTGPNNHVATYVVAPSVRPGTKVKERFTAYSLLRTTEELLHLPLLGGARHARSMARAFHLTT